MRDGKLRGDLAMAEPEVLQALKRIPLLTGERAEAIATERLGGLTNRNYKIAVLAKLGTPLPDGYHDVVREAESVRQALDKHPAALAPCHCDPLSENFLDDGKRMWVVDWEYSGMNDPLWDLGDMSVEAGFD